MPLQSIKSILARLASFSAPRSTHSSLSEAIGAKPIDPLQTPLTTRMGEDPAMRDICASFGKRDAAESAKLRAEHMSTRPPIGPAPEFVTDDERVNHAEVRVQTEFNGRWRDLALHDNRIWAERYRKLQEQHATAFAKLQDAEARVEVLDSKRLDLERMVSVMEAQHADHEKIVAEWQGRADACRDAIEFTIWLASEFPGDGVEWLKDWSEGDEVAEKEFQNWRAKHDRGGEARAESEMSGPAMVGRDGLRDVPIAVGHERPEPAPVQSAGANDAPAEAVPPSPHVESVVRAVHRPTLKWSTHEGAAAAAAWCKNPQCAEHDYCQRHTDCISTIPLPFATGNHNATVNEEPLAPVPDMMDLDESPFALKMDPIETISRRLAALEDRVAEIGRRLRKAKI